MVSNDAPVCWPIEFAKVIGCRLCSKATDKNLLRDDGENVPQPGYIGSNYDRSKLLLVGQNPAIPPVNLQEKDKKYTVALRQLRDVPTQLNYKKLQSILDDFIPHWPVRGQYFPLESCGLSLADIAYLNLVRCRTMVSKLNAKPENATPNDTIALDCRRTHFETWLDLLAPKAIVFIGLWACAKGGSACAARGIPYIAVNRSKSLTKQMRMENLSAIKLFVHQYIISYEYIGESTVGLSAPGQHTYVTYTADIELGPKAALEILDRLQELGFDDEAFWRIHHFRLRSEREKISVFKKYCERTTKFARGGTNERVHQRLILVMRKYEEQTAASGNVAGFTNLADAAFVEIPPL